MTAQARRTRMPALLFCVGMFLALLPGYTAAQEIICCNHLLSFGGNWFGALRQCRESMEKGSEQQRRSVCKQLKGNFCADVASFCKACTGNEAKDLGGKALGPGDPIYDGMVDGVRAAGITGFGPEHIGIQRAVGGREKGGFFKWQIRVDADGCLLPNGDCILSAGEKGYLPHGKQVGAKQMLLGGIQFSGNALRVNGRYVNVETGVVEGAANSEIVTGTGREAIAQGMADMLRKLDMRCKQAHGLVY